MKQMDTTTPLPANELRVLPEQCFSFEIDNGTLVLFIEPSRNIFNPYMMVRYQFHNRIPGLKTEQRN